MMDLEEKTVAKNYIYRGKIVDLRCDDAVLPDGRPCKREVIEHSGGAAVLCVREGSVALVRQFRYAYGEAIYEIPSWKRRRGCVPNGLSIGLRSIRRPAIPTRRSTSTRRRTSRRAVSISTKGSFSTWNISPWKRRSE